MKGTAGMNTEEARVKTSGRHARGHQVDERGLKLARERDLPRRSVEILRDLGLSKEKIVAYHRRFPTQRPQREARRHEQGERENLASKESFDPPFDSPPRGVPARR
jgi:hypothetical protein